MQFKGMAVIGVDMLPNELSHALLEVVRGPSKAGTSKSLFTICPEALNRIIC